MARFFAHIQAGILPQVMVVVFLLAFVVYAIWVYRPSRRKFWEDRGQLPLQNESQESPE